MFFYFYTSYKNKKNNKFPLFVEKVDFHFESLLYIQLTLIIYYIMKIMAGYSKSEIQNLD